MEQPGEQAPLRYADVPYKVRVALEREERRMSGYRYGKDLSDEFLSALCAGG